MYARPAKEGIAAGCEGPPRLQASTPALFGARMTDEEVALVQARRTLQFIEAARDCFPAMRELADHPGWEMMLQLFIAPSEGRLVNTTDICALTGTWRPLAVRYIEMLLERGLVEREVADGKLDDWAISLTVSAQEQLQELLCGFARTVAAADEAGATN